MQDSLSTSHTAEPLVWRTLLAGRGFGIHGGRSRRLWKACERLEVRAFYWNPQGSPRQSADTANNEHQNPLGTPSLALDPCHTTPSKR